MTSLTVTSNQLWAALVGTMLVRSFYTFLRAVALTAETAAPWAVLAAGAAAFLLFWPVAAALARRPGTSLVDLALEAGGRPAAIGLAVTLATLLTAGTGIGLRQASELVVTGFLSFTPGRAVSGAGRCPVDCALHPGQRRSGGRSAPDRRAPAAGRFPPA